MSYTLCAGCAVELRKAESYACDGCWGECLSKSPRVEWRKFSEQVDIVPPTRSCDYCHRRNFKWLAHATLCNSCYFQENTTFKEDVAKTLQFLRDLNPSPSCENFKGDVTFLVTQCKPNRRENVHDGHQDPDVIQNQNADPLLVMSLEHGSGDPDAHKEPDHPNPPCRIQAHRFILASKSSVFRKMFESESMKEENLMTGHTMEKRENAESDAKDKNYKTEIEIEGIAAPVLRAVINFLYTAEIDFCETISPLEVLRFAHEYDIPWLKNVCESELSKRITTNNLSDMLRFSYRLQAENLKRAARKFFEEHPDEHARVLDALLSSGAVI